MSLISCQKNEIKPSIKNSNNQTGITPLIPVYAITIHNDNQTHNVDYNSFVTINGVINNHTTFLVRPGDIVKATVSITTPGICCDSIKIDLVRNGLSIKSSKNLLSVNLIDTIK